MNDSDNERAEFLAYCYAMGDIQASPPSATATLAGTESLARRDANPEHPGATSHGNDVLAQAASPPVPPSRDREDFPGADHVKSWKGVTTGKGDSASRVRSIDHFESTCSGSAGTPCGGGGDCGGGVDASSVSSSSRSTVDGANPGLRPRGKILPDVASCVRSDLSLIHI